VFCVFRRGLIDVHHAPPLKIVKNVLIIKTSLTRRLPWLEAKREIVGYLR